jgi:hypothetical protein
VRRLLKSADEVRFRFGMSSEIRQRHTKKHPALDRVRIEFPRLLQKFHSLLQVPSALKRHCPRKIPGIEILRTLTPHLGINPFRLVVLVGLVKRQCFLKKIGSLFVVHSPWVNYAKIAAWQSKMHDGFYLVSIGHSL